MLRNSNAKDDWEKLIIRVIINNFINIIRIRSTLVSKNIFLHLFLHNTINLYAEELQNLRNENNHLKG